MTKGTTITDSTGGVRKSRLWRSLGLGLSLPAMLAAAPAAQAFQVYSGQTSGTNNLEVNLDITTSYTGLYRVQKPSALLVSGVTNANGNDGDANFRSGIVGNTFEVLPVLDIKDESFGMHFSGEYFINTVYLKGNQNNQPGTVNPVLGKNTDFASETRTADGMNGRMLDAFVYDGWTFGGDQRVTLKAGQQTLFWGQSLFFGTDGISGGQAPIDVISAENLVNPEVQQIYLPVGQIVATYQPNDTYTLQGYYQYQWASDSFQGVGSYFNSTDVIGPGGYRIIADSLGTSNFYLLKTKDLTPPSQNGQFGLSLQATYDNYDLGLFGLRYDSKTPEVYNFAPTAFTPTPGGTAVGKYTVVYPRDIWIYGASASTTIGVANVAGELSTHTHMPLIGGANAGSQTLANMGNANNDPLYPVGDTATALVSAIYSSSALKLVPGGVTVTGEVEYVDLYRVTANKALLAPGRSKASAAFDVEVSPAYLNVLPSLNLTFPVSLLYHFAGNSLVNGTNHGTGQYSVGISATYRQTWDATFSYVGYLGNINPGVGTETSQIADRGYVSLNLQHTF